MSALPQYIYSQEDATVIQIVAPEKSVVEGGDTVVVVKNSDEMHVPVLTDFTGMVTRMAVVVGQQVHSGDLIAVVDQPGSVF